MAGINEYNIVAASNTDINGIDIDEGCLPSGVNNAIRQQMADTRAFANDIGGKAVSGGTANAQTLTTETGLTAYADGTILSFIAGFSNTGAATLSVDAVGAKSIRKLNDLAVATGDIIAGMPYVVVYDESANAAAGAWMLVTPTPLPRSLLTTRGDIIFRNATVPTRLAAGTEGQVLTMGADDPEWATGGFPSGTKMLFVQTAAPTGWTKDTDQNNKALRIVSGVAGAGGTVAFTTAFTTNRTTTAVALTIAQMPAHGHAYRISSNNNTQSGYPGGFLTNDSNAKNAGPHTGTPSDTDGDQIGGTGGGATHAHTTNIDVQFVDVIKATKD